MAGRGAGGYDGYDMHGYSSYHSGAPPSGSGAAARGQTSNERSRQTQIISTNIHKLTQNVDQMNRLINQIGTPTDTVELHDKLHQVQHYSNQLAKETSEVLKDLSRIPVSGTPSEKREQRMQQERLLNSFSTALHSFQTAQRRQKDREGSVRVRSGRAGLAGDAFADRPSSEKLFPLDGGPKQQQQQQQLLEEDDEEVELLRDREQTMRQLENDISDVNQIFKDLSVLVHEQGDVIDSIEANVERSALNVERGTEQLLHARNYQSKLRKRKFCILIVVLVIVTILAIIIGVSVSSRR